MRTHIKEAVTTLVTFVALVGSVHVGIWFSLFGVPEFSVLNWPFHYFWLVVGSWLSIITIYAAYNRYAAGLAEVKEGIRDETDDGDPSEPAETPGAVEPEGE